MVKFKSKYSKKGTFSFNNVNYEFDNFKFETKDKELISFLINNNNFICLNKKEVEKIKKKSTKNKKDNTVDVDDTVDDTDNM